MPAVIATPANKRQINLHKRLVTMYRKEPYKWIVVSLTLILSLYQYYVFFSIVNILISEYVVK